MNYYRSRSTIEGWLDEFRALGYPTVGEVRVLDQDGSDGGNTGLVRVGMAHATTGSYIQPLSVGSPRWMVTMEARDEAITLSPSEVISLATELTSISALCAFLEARSIAQTEDDQD